MSNDFEPPTDWTPDLDDELEDDLGYQIEVLQFVVRQLNRSHPDEVRAAFARANDEFKNDQNDP